MAPGFSLFELTLVVLIIGIVAAVLIPAVGNNLQSSRLSTAANVLASDIEFCSNECMAYPSHPRQIVFDTAGNEYSMEDEAGKVIAHPADRQPFTNDFSTGRNAQLQGVTIKSIVMGNGTLNVLTFDAYGRPLITANWVLQLQYGTATMSVTVTKGTGETSITTP